MPGRGERSEGRKMLLNGGKIRTGEWYMIRDG